jgi:hypothetical protein
MAPNTTSTCATTNINRGNDVVHARPTIDRRSVSLRSRTDRETDEAAPRQRREKHIHASSIPCVPQHTRRDRSTHLPCRDDAPNKSQVVTPTRRALGSPTFCGWFGSILTVNYIGCAIYLWHLTRDEWSRLPRPSRDTTPQTPSTHAPNRKEPSIHNHVFLRYPAAPASAGQISLCKGVGAWTTAIGCCPRRVLCGTSERLTSFPTYNQTRRQVRRVHG